ncbi:DNA-binding response regulator, AraC family [Streptococcus infantarius subsp. infantarius]|nr:DNA-binding response regulator, AraC family [Streptococcus infantarius subsp. infantarius]MCO4531730.1 DNA-binding response regulator, AraC family [Streptococcus infantarius subsp. infantarius]MCO4533246.1 DNA-binding response regulator, AraC family [Streptococcus infantarius subsp. infantarius]MCO4535382.1 DNA-binding response regulator, AraC family [Streptococcus infantarius subsp. infantarius]MCO4537800.1 DNA-binding response regulator, AraC family [Streptococcus infantarius subsp. infant
MNQSVKSYIQTQKISVAKNMLLESDYSLLEISETLAFSSQSYLTKIFKKVTGEKPLDYRANHLTDAIHSKGVIDDRT